MMRVKIRRIIGASVGQRGQKFDRFPGWTRGGDNDRKIVGGSGWIDENVAEMASGDQLGRDLAVSTSMRPACVCRPRVGIYGQEVPAMLQSLATKSAIFALVNRFCMSCYNSASNFKSTPNVANVGIYIRRF